MRLTSSIGCALLLASASIASAQTGYRLGLVISVPTAAGVQCQGSDRFALVIHF